MSTLFERLRAFVREYFKLDSEKKELALVCRMECEMDHIFGKLDFDWGKVDGMTFYTMAMGTACLILDDQNLEKMKRGEI